MSDIKIINGKVSTKNAYVIVLFGDPEYCLGAMVTCHSLKLLTKNDVVCIVCGIHENWVKRLCKVFDCVFEAPVISAECKILKGKKQQDLYKSWMNISFSKWNILGLTYYQKVILVDADKVVLDNPDLIFEMSAPSATFSVPQSEQYYKTKNIDNKNIGKYGIKDPYIGLKHGDEVKNEQIKLGLGMKFPSFVCIGTMILLEPNRDEYNGFCEYMSIYNKKNPFGFDNCVSMMDEQSICHYYNLIGKKWYYISQRYQWIPWKVDWLREFEKPPAVFHYFGHKIWKLKRSEWFDGEVWWNFAENLIEKFKDDSLFYNELIECYCIEKSDAYGCPYCKVYKKEWNNHLLIDNNCKIVCKFWIKEKNQM